jgi:hypothetical protein
MSDTPKTDAEEVDLHVAVREVTNPNGTRRMVTRYVDADFARQLELKLAKVEREVVSLRAFKNSVDEALNSGDGTYRP